ncbi:phage collar protein [Paraburkholderia elongata]|uniref:Uncharacterized protein n=1 Tax=Paraburkholderia elongata TaxID=2675747 RepID=A0A972NU11_9BURK|nr:hypothetical protein [Paraburkholderia elongata]NPT59101.1 hypothetical protein [Paraburkholderia elongata]
MNLSGIVGNYVAAVNPWVTASIQASTGYSTSPDGDRVPSYASPASIQVQMQAMTYRDLVQIEGLNINGEKRSMYINGTWEGVARPDGRGGDLITLLDGSVWLVVQVLENWGYQDGWTKVAVVRQNGG